jgi:hypothetical protein
MKFEPNTVQLRPRTTESNGCSAGVLAGGLRVPKQLGALQPATEDGGATPKGAPRP